MHVLPNQVCWLRCSLDEYLGAIWPCFDVFQGLISLKGLLVPECSCDSLLSLKCHESMARDHQFILTILFDLVDLFLNIVDANPVLSFDERASFLEKKDDLSLVKGQMCHCYFGLLSLFLFFMLGPLSLASISLIVSRSFIVMDALDPLLHLLGDPVAENNLV